MGAYYNVMKLLRDHHKQHGPEAAPPIVPEALKPDVAMILERYQYARRKGYEVKFSKYMLSLLQLQTADTEF